MAPLEREIRSFGVRQEQRDSRPQDDWMHEQPKLVNQLVRDELPNQIAAAYEPQVSPNDRTYLGDDGSDFSVNVANAFVRRWTARS